MENNRTNLLVILAGYKDKMQGLLNADPGLPRRFPNQVIAYFAHRRPLPTKLTNGACLQVHLADYSPAELALIAEVKEFRECVLSPSMVADCGTRQVQLEIRVGAGGQGRCYDQKQASVYHSPA